MEEIIMNKEKLIARLYKIIKELENGKSVYNVLDDLSGVVSMIKRNS
jgi:hypothetical protein